MIYYLVLIDNIDYLKDGQDGSDNETSVEDLDDDQINLKAIVSAMRNKSVHKLRSDGTVTQYKLYCELCYPSIVGKHRWKINHSRVGIKTLTTVADEAIVALVLENNIFEWLHLAEGKEVDTKHRLTLYTHGGRDGSGTRKGWSLEGRRRYNVVHNELKEIRNRGGSTRLDDALKQMWMDESHCPNSTGDNGGIDNDEYDRVEESFEPAFDFDD